MTNQNSTQNQKDTAYEEKVRKIAERIWKMWQRDLRNERERRGKKGR